MSKNRGLIGNVDENNKGHGESSLVDVRPGPIMSSEVRTRGWVGKRGLWVRPVRTQYKSRSVYRLTKPDTSTTSKSSLNINT